MVVLVPPSGATGKVPGTLVKMRALKSARGKELNGKYGLVCGSTEGGRLQVEILGWRTNNAMYPEEPVDNVMLKPENTQPLDKNAFERYGIPLFEKYQRQKCDYLRITKGTNAALPEMYDLMSELFAQPWFKPTIGDKMTMNVLLRNSGKVEEAIAVCRECMEELPPASAELRYVRYQFAVTLTFACRLEEAMAIASEMEINNAEPGTIHDKLRVLECIMRHEVADERFGAVKARAEQAWDAVPKDWQTMQKIGEEMCDIRDFNIGIQYYERALRDAPNNEQLREKLELARIQQRADENGGRVFVGFGADDSGQVRPVHYIDTARAGRQFRNGVPNAINIPAPRHSS